MRRWGHGHSLGTGVVVGLLLDHRVWLLAVLFFAAGWVLRDFYSAARWTAMVVGSAWARRHPERAMARKLLRDRVPW